MVRVIEVINFVVFHEDHLLDICQGFLLSPSDLHLPLGDGVSSQLQIAVLNYQLKLQLRSEMEPRPQKLRSSSIMGDLEKLDIVAEDSEVTA